MNGWLILLLMIAVALGLLWLLRLRSGLLTASAAALLLGASGYALQGRPELKGVPARGSADREILPLTDARQAFYGNFTHAETWIRISEALARAGRSEDSVGILQNAVKRYPYDPQLWIALGNALVEHGRGLTPPAELAFQRAAAVSPGYPAPRFFYGLALARSGDREGALAEWRALLADAPADASWRPLVERGVAALSQPQPAR
ncbi:MAG: tetratricopeptide repeat protein [Pseudomonadota bacterium]